ALETLHRVQPQIATGLPGTVTTGTTRQQKGANTPLKMFLPGTSLARINGALRSGCDTRNDDNADGDGNPVHG
ncbi:MAG: hypothetical protein MK364_06465, partial [Pirellulales bacterium]|nr:hypothetical protein [Pirellulales bacterium]